MQCTSLFSHILKEDSQPIKPKHLTYLSRWSPLKATNLTDPYHQPTLQRVMTDQVKKILALSMMKKPQIMKQLNCCKASSKLHSQRQSVKQATTIQTVLMALWLVLTLEEGERVNSVQCPSMTPVKKSLGIKKHLVSTQGRNQGSLTARKIDERFAHDITT